MLWDVVGQKNFKLFQDKIERWLDRELLSTIRLKKKTSDLIDAKETKHFAHQGKVVETREVAALETQRKTLEMAMKMKGLLAEGGGESGAQIIINVSGDESKTQVNIVKKERAKQGAEGEEGEVVAVMD